jgi:hypothetical protein
VEELQVRSLAAIALVAALAAGCGKGTGPKYSLEGSLSVVMDLGYDECFLDTTTDEIAIRFVRHRDSGDDTPLKVTWAQAGQTLNTPATIDLGEARPDDATRQRSIVSRNVLDDPRRVFPLLVVGEPCGMNGCRGPSKLSFVDKIMQDSKVRGQFNITFVNGVEFANGRTVYGQFIAKVPP